MTRRITVVGAGVIGLSIAYELASAGHEVTVIADTDTADTVSAVSAALWFPFRSDPSAQAAHLLERSLLRFNELSENPASGVEQRSGIVAERTLNPDRSWARLLSDVVEAAHDQIPHGALSGVRVTVPFIIIPVYLPWLREQVAGLGVTFAHGTVTDLAELRESADLAVIAAGIRGGELLGGDPAVFPVRGQIVRLANPGLDEWITDTDNPDGVTYVFPRRDDVVVGGTAIDGSWDTTVHPDVEAAILARACRLVPALAGQPVLGRAAGLRPGRSTIRLEHVSGQPLPVIAAYGHGGAGVTLSWGTAERVRELVEED